MKILVIEDNAVDQQSARETLAGHDVTIAASYHEAHKVLDSAEEFDVVLIALELPIGDHVYGCGPEHRVAYGVTLALFAVLRGAKHVAVVSPTRYADPSSVALDDISRTVRRNRYCSVPNFTINGAVCMFGPSPCVVVKQPACPTCGCTPDRPVEAKHWGLILHDLLYKDPS